MHFAVIVRLDIEEDVWRLVEFGSFCRYSYIRMYYYNGYHAMNARARNLSFAEAAVEFLSYYRSAGTRKL